MEMLRYLGTACICAAVCWLIYFAFLRNRAAHRASRAYLLMALVLSGVVPLIRLPQAALPAAATLSYTLPEFRTGSNVGASGNQYGFWLAAGYLLISATVAGIYAVGYLRLSRLLRSMPAEAHRDYQLIRAASIGPGTLGRRIFLPEGYADPAILAHELAHIRCGHRFDLLLLVISRSLFWISPAHWLLGRELKIVHEFEADAIAAAGAPQQGYTKLLLRLQFELHPGPVTSHAFFHHPLKRRVMMLQRKSGGRAAIAAAAFILTAGFATTLVLAQSEKAVVASVNAPRTPLPPDALRNNYMQPRPGTVQTTSDGRILLSKVDQMPQFNGNIWKWLNDNLRSPEKDMKGQCVVQFTVDQNGSVIMPVVTKSSNNSRLDAEALRVVGAMPKWKPGMQNGKAVPVLYTLPFHFGEPASGC